MDSIIRAVTALWDFLVFPVVLLCVLAAVLYAVMLPGRVAADAAIARLSSKRLQTAQIGSKLEIYGLAKAVPLAVLFTLVFLLNAARSVATSVGAALPGGLVYDRGALILHTADPEKLNLLWARRPLLRDPAQLGTQVGELAAMIRARDSSGLGANALQWQRRMGQAVGRLDVVKFVVMVAVLAYLTRLRVRERRGQRTRNLLLVFIVGAIVGTYFFTEEVYALEQTGYADFQAVWTSSLEGDTISVQPARDRLDSIMEYRQRSGERWWQLHWGTSSYPRWLYKTFIAPPVLRDAHPYAPRRVGGSFDSR